MSDASNQNASVTRIPSWAMERLGHPPPPTVVKDNPAHEKWIERCALMLCDEAGELGEIPTPCFPHLREARAISAHMRTTYS